MTAWTTKAMALGLVAAAGLTSACSPMRSSHGYIPEKAQLSEITVEEDTKATVLARYGNPSTRGVFEENTWYYITNTRQQIAYQKPQSFQRTVTMVTFDRDGVVSSVDTFDQDDGNEIAMVRRETPTRGRELSVLEQILGNVGRLPGETLSDQENLPGGAGGPR